MKHYTLMEKYPVNEWILSKNDTIHTNVDEILVALKEKMQAHPVATYIATFDHYEHTKNLSVGEISDDILDAKNIICCFGKQLTNVSMLALRPRSIGVVELAEHFVITFMDAPNPQAQETMVQWVKSL